MNKHRIRMVELPEDPIPVVFIEIETDSWLDLSIDLTPEDNLHDLLHEFLRDMKNQRSIPITYDTRSFDIYPNLNGYQESIIE